MAATPIAGAAGWRLGGTSGAKVPSVPIDFTRNKEPALAFSNRSNWRM